MKRRAVSRLYCFVSVLLSALCSVGCHRTITEPKLAFFDERQKPLLVRDVLKELGDTEVGRGPYYEYAITPGRTRLEVWMAMPPPPEEIPPEGGIPLEVTMVVKRSGDQRTIIWPQNLRGVDFSAVHQLAYPKGY